MYVCMYGVYMQACDRRPACLSQGKRIAVKNEPLRLACALLCLSVCLYIRVCMRIYVCVCMYACMYVHASTNTHTHTHRHILKLRYFDAKISITIYKTNSPEIHHSAHAYTHNKNSCALTVHCNTQSQKCIAPSQCAHIRT
jgi:hypothetical protein